MTNKILWTPTSGERLRQIKRVLSDQAEIHQAAVDIAREQSGFTDERAINAYAVTIKIGANDILSSPGWLFLDKPAARLALKTPGSFFEFAQSNRVSDPDAFVWCVSIAFNLPEGDVRAILRHHEIDQKQFAAIKDHFAFGELVALMWRARDKEEDADPEQVAALNAKAFGLEVED